ncbi:hypothetical protein [Ascidiimonas sp. W6]|uniref:hypothetical protein n=1 Tax=Ascidiimonas meishanensis TaxID=3128903 RepID=UPI0030ECE3E6
MRKLICTLLLISICNNGIAQLDASKSLGGIDFFIHEEVTNADSKVAQKLIELWQNYISDGNFQDPKSPYWSFEKMNVPDENFWAIDIVNLKKKEYKVQCKIIGIFEVENGYWSLISSFSHIDNSGEIHLDVISSVYAKEINNKLLLISSAEYLKTVFKYQKVGNINYYIHPFHQFKIEEAAQMNAFNLEMAKEFGVNPLKFDYFVASNARDIARTWGYEYMNRMYNPSGKGGIASWRNMIIYSGNNSSYFPHELVHLYTYHVVPKDPHLWVGEGIATLFSGTSTYSFHEHMLKLKQFLAEYPEYDLSDISKLKKTIPNGEYKSDFRYVIGALLMKNIYEKEGIKGLIESLKYGTSDEDFYLLINDKLGITKDSFDKYIKKEMKEYTE